MRTSAKLILTALTAALVLASAVSTASARNLQVSEQSWRVSWASLELGSSVTTIRCRVTLEGSFHSRTFQKIERSLIGHITTVTVAHPCTNGEAWADNGRETQPLGLAPNRLPFHLTYENFTGVLPDISAIGLLLRGVSFAIQTVALGITVRCRFGRVEDNISGIASRAAGGGITAIRPVSGRDRVNLVDGLLNGGFCPREGTFIGSSGPVTGLTNTNTITVTLI